MVVSGAHLLATRANLRAAHEKEHDRQLWEEAHGSCHRCRYDHANPPICEKCINGGGSKDMFREKSRRRKLKSAAGVR